MSDIYAFCSQLIARVEARRVALANEALGGSLAIEDYRAVCRARQELDIIVGELTECQSAFIAASGARLVPRATPDPVLDFSGRAIGGRPGADSYGSAA